MTAITPRDLLRRTWEVRPTQLELAVIIITLGLLNLIFGLPLGATAIVVGLLLGVAAVVTAVVELLEEGTAAPAAEPVAEAVPEGEREPDEPKVSLGKDGPR